MTEEWPNPDPLSDAGTLPPAGDAPQGGPRRVLMAMPAIDAWGSGGDAFPLMLRVKQQFDPRGTLNPGRFIGGI